MKKIFMISVLFLGLFLSACSNSNNLNINTSKMPKNNVILQTSMGKIEMKIFTKEIPTIANNFLNLAKAGKYDKTIFHRVIDGFMIQGGDYENFNGTGGKAFKSDILADEINPDFSHLRGMVSMANRGKDTNGSQFFIVQKDSTFLDGNYSIFGQIVSGMEVVDKIAKAKKDINDKPLDDIILEKVLMK